MELEIQNGIPWSLENFLADSLVRPWQVTAPGHEQYLMPEVMTPAYLPRVIAPAGEHPLEEMEPWEGESAGRAVPTSWVGSRQGVVARTPRGVPILRTIRYVSHADARDWELWRIADAYWGEGDEMVPCRVTFAIGGRLARVGDREGLRWAREVIGGREDPVPGWEQSYYGARAMYEVAYGKYPHRVQEALTRFREEDRRVLDRAHERDRLRAETDYACLSMVFVVLRLLREPDADGRMPDAVKLLGQNIERSEVPTRALIREAEKVGVLTPPRGGRGERDVTDLGRDRLVPVLGNPWGGGLAMRCERCGLGTMWH